MSIKIGGNIFSLIAQRRLDLTSQSLSKVSERLASGSRINRASDDAAGLAIAEDLNTRGRVFAQGVRNLNDGVSVLNIADSGVEQLTQLTIRLKELAEQSANGVLSNRQRVALDTEAQALSREYSRIIQTTSFNGVKLFNGSMSSGLSLQGGYGTSAVIQGQLGGLTGTGTSSSGMTYESGSGGEYIQGEMVDLNSDGILDFVGLRWNDGTNGGGLEVRLGLGDGQFSSASVLATFGFTAYSFGVADIDGDGIQDLAVSGLSGFGGTDTMLLFKGNGSGSFTSQGSVTDISNFLLADMNGDSKADLITSSGGNTVVRFSSGGTFGAATTIMTGATPLAVVDFNGDGNLDILSSNGGNLFVSTSSGSGTFSAAISYAQGGSQIESVVLADFNNDGIKDLLSSSDSVLKIRMGLGGGNYGSLNTIGASADAFGVGDLDGDGNLDIVTGLSETVSLLRGVGNGTFQSATSVGNTGYGPVRDFVITDLNNDGVSDTVAVGGDASDDGIPYLRTFIGNTQGGIAALQAFSLSSQLSSRQALSQFDSVITRLSQQRGIIGAFQSRVTIASNTLSSVGEQYKAAESRIRDTDVARDAGELVRLQILQEGSARLLSLTNAQPRLALELLQA